MKTYYPSVACAKCGQEHNNPDTINEQGWTKSGTWVIFCRQECPCNNQTKEEDEPTTRPD